jgi:very-short-patch-repair endonuclease
MPTITELCRKLRQLKTPAEKVLWYHLKNRNFVGYKFFRQFPICAQISIDRNSYYIPDFYCSEAKLVIEADGPIHNFKKEYDKNRDEVLKTLGLTILRFTNNEILKDPQSILKSIKQELIKYPI